MPYLTPEAIPTDDFVCRLIEIPNTLNAIAAVNGALFELVQVWNWEQSSDTAETPQNMSDAMALMYYKYSRSMCRVIGEVRSFATADLPDFCLPCDGGTYDKDDYPALYDALDGNLIVSSTQFKTPDMRHRAPIGTGQLDGFGSSADVGDTIGEQNITLTTSNMPAHTHSEVTAIPAIINGGLEAPAAAAEPSIGVTGSAGLGTAHENRGPRTALRYGIVFK